MSTEQAVRNIVRMMYDYNKAMRAYLSEEETVKGRSVTTDEEQSEQAKQLARIQVDRERYAETAQASILKAAADAVQAEEDKEATRKAATSAADQARLQSAGYQSAVGNAMKMIEALGDGMTKEQLQDIVRPFVQERDYHTIDVLKTMARKSAPQLFMMGGGVDFGRTPEDTLHFLRKFQSLIPRSFDSGLGAATAIMFIEQLVDSFFGTPGDE